MGFFESLPDPPPLRPVRPRGGPSAPWTRPEHAIPAGVPVNLILIHTQDVAVTVHGLQAYEHGFEFTLREDYRMESIGGRTTMPGGSPPIIGADGNLAPPSEQMMLQFGLLFADGRRGAIGRVAPAFQREAPPTGELWLAPGRSGGSPRRWDREFWVYPLPLEGPVTFIASWLEHGVSEARAQVEAALIRQAAEHAAVLWPENEPPPPAGTG